MPADHALSAKVGDLMTQKVVEIDVGLTADEVARLIVKHKIESFPVTENGILVGIVTGWDLLTKVVANAMNPGKVRAREFMTHSPITCSPNDSVLQVTKLMTKHDIKHIPVVKMGEVVGIFTTYDVKIFKQLVQQADFSSYTPLSRDEIITEQESEKTKVSPILPGRVATGYRNLDKLLLGGIPENYSVILTSPSCDERDLLIAKFLETGATSGEATFYVTSNPVEEKPLTEKFQSHCYLFICNPQAGAIMKNYLNVFKIRGVENLTDINIALASGFHLLDVSNIAHKRPRRVCIEIISDVLLQHRVVQTRRWLSALILELQSKGFTTLAVLDPQMHPAQEVRAVLGLFEGEINIYRKGSKSWMKIRRLRNREYSKSEQSLEEV